MKAHYVLPAAMLVGAALGAVGVGGLHAQAKPPVYMIAINDVSNPDGYKNEYLPPAQASIKAQAPSLRHRYSGTDPDYSPEAPAEPTTPAAPNAVSPATPPGGGPDI